MFSIYGSLLWVFWFGYMTKVTAEAKEAEVPRDEGEKEL